MAHPIAVLEVGTSETRVLVAEPREDGHLMITGIGKTPSSGIRKSEIVDLENAKICVKSALTEAENNAGVSIQEVWLVFSGAHIRHLVNRGTVTVMSEDRVISVEEREEAMEAARAVSLPHDCESLHNICGPFHVDGDKEGILNPDGMTGSRLSVDMLILYGSSNRMRNLFRLVEESGVEVADLAFGGLCAGFSVLTPQQKEVGAILIDLGAGTTDFVVYSDRVVTLAGSLGVGGDHVTNDLAMGLNLSTQQAERVKTQSGAAMVDLGTRGRRVAVPPETGFRARDILSRDVNTVIHARMEEVFELIRDRIRDEVPRKNFGAGVILTGGGARMQRIQDLASRVFEMPCHIGVPRDTSGLALPAESPEYASLVGMLKYGLREQTSTVPGPGLGGLLRRVFRKP